MAAKEADVNGSEFGNESDNQSVVEVVLLDDNGSESHADDGAIKTGIASCFSSASSFYVFRAIPPFLQKLYEMLGNDEFSPVVSWSWNGTSFVIKDPHSFVADVLPLYYRHNNFQSFISQLHSYGFKKASWEQCEYKNEYFVKGQRNLLRNIKRRDYYAKVSQPCSNTNRSATTSNQLTNFKRKHHEIEAEIIKLKERQLTLEQHLASLRNRTRSNEEDSSRMMIVAHKILEKGISRSNDGLPMLEETRETEQRKGKRKIEVLEEEEGGGDRVKDLPDAFFSMEELCGGPMEWVKYVKEWPESSSFNPKS